MDIVNLTGHPLVLGSEGNHITFPSRGRVRVDARYDVTDHVTFTQDGITVTVPILTTGNGTVFSLPEPTDGTLIVVSGLVAGRVRRRDVVSPARLHKIDNKVQYARALMRYVP